MKSIILVYPPALFRNPQVVELMREQGMQSPISIEHSLTACERCDEQCWIGPQQLAVARRGLGEVVCFYCLMKDPDAAGSMGMISLNPDIDDVPRRSE